MFPLEARWLDDTAVYNEVRMIINNKTPAGENLRECFVSNYRYLEVLTFTPGPMVETTVQDLIY